MNFMPVDEVKIGARDLDVSFSEKGKEGIKGAEIPLSRCNCLINCCQLLHVHTSCFGH